MDKSRVHGLLLTGGTSRRMGADKAALKVGAEPMGMLAGRALLEAADLVLALGPDPGLGLESVEDPGRGPLAALACGMRHLSGRGLDGPVLLLACDLPFITPGLLHLLVESLADAGAAVPVADGRLQPLAACYSPSVGPVAQALVDRGQLSMRALLGEIVVNEVEQEVWKTVAPAEALDDVDTPEDLRLANELMGTGQ